MENHRPFAQENTTLILEDSMVVRMEWKAGKWQKNTGVLSYIFLASNVIFGGLSLSLFTTSIMRDLHKEPHNVGLAIPEATTSQAGPRFL